MGRMDALIMCAVGEAEAEGQARVRDDGKVAMPGDEIVMGWEELRSLREIEGDFEEWGDAVPINTAAGRWLRKQPGSTVLAVER